MYNRIMEHKTSVEWDKIKTEYMTTGTSMRALSKKYGIPCSTISFRANKEGWKKTIETIEAEALKKTVQRAVDLRVSNNEKALMTLNTLMDKATQATAMVGKRDVKAMKDLVAIMKDLKELGAYQVVTDTGEADIKVDMGGADEYAK